MRGLVLVGVFFSAVFGIAYVLYQDNLRHETKRQEVIARWHDKNQELENAVYGLVSSLEKKLVIVQKNIARLPEQYLPEDCAPEVLRYRLKEHKVQIFGESTRSIVSDIQDTLQGIVLIDVMLRERQAVIKDDEDARWLFFSKLPTEGEQKIAAQEYEALLADFKKKESELQGIVIPPSPFLSFGRN